MRLADGSGHEAAGNRGERGSGHEAADDRGVVGGGREAAGNTGAWTDRLRWRGASICLKGAQRELDHI